MRMWIQQRQADHDVRRPQGQAGKEAGAVILPSLEMPARGDCCPYCGTQREVVSYCGACDEAAAELDPSERG
jgi:hypothetical protein